MITRFRVYIYYKPAGSVSPVISQYIPAVQSVHSDDDSNPVWFENVPVNDKCNNDLSM